MPESASSFEKFPATVKIQRVVESPLGGDVSLYFVTGVMDADQRDTIKEHLPVQAEFVLDGGRVVVSALVSHSQLLHAYEVFTPGAKEWRGRYYVITNRFVDAYREAVGSS